MCNCVQCGQVSMRGEMEKREYGSDKEQLCVHNIRVRAVGWL